MRCGGEFDCNSECILYYPPFSSLRAPFLHILAISLTHTHVYLSISVAKDPSSRIANCTFEWNREKGSGEKFTDCKKYTLFRSCEGDIYITCLVSRCKIFGKSLSTKLRTRTRSLSVRNRDFLDEEGKGNWQMLQIPRSERASERTRAELKIDFEFLCMSNFERRRASLHRPNGPPLHAFILNCRLFRKEIVDIPRPKVCP